MKKHARWLFLFLFASVGNNAGSSENLFGQVDYETIIKHITSLNRATKWQLVGTIKQNYRTYHPQGMVKIGESYYVSSVEQIVKTQRLANPGDGYDRSPGRGIGHLFKINANGDLISETVLGDDIIYHPGGIDYDGDYIWVPVAEYRPFSNTVIYRVDPETLDANEVFRFADHIGAIVYNRHNQTLLGVNWGSRKFYVWQLHISDDQVNLVERSDVEMKLNGNHYVDYQDCHYLGGQYMLCSGLSKHTIPNKGVIALGGIDLVDLDSLVAIHQVPIDRWLKANLVITNNPFYFEMVDDRLRFYFMPEDDSSTLYIYEALN